MSLKEDKTFKEYTRQELYTLIWSKPISKVIQDYALTNSAFKKICRNYDIPLPKRGYWQKLKFDKVVFQTPLSLRKKVYENIKLPYRIEGEINLEKLSELNLLIREIRNDKSLPIEVPEKLSKPDKIIVRTRDYFKNKKKDSYPRITKVPDDGVFSISVSKALERRALIFANSLIKLFEKRGHKAVVITNHKYANYNGTKLIVNGEYYSIRIREIDKRVMEKHHKYDWMEARYYPTGKLVLKIDNFNTYEWKDGVNKKIEQKLPDILAYLELRSQREKKERIESNIRQQENERKRKIEIEINRRKNKELDTFRSLLNRSSRWQKSIYLKNYIEVLEKNAFEKGLLTDEIKKNFQWMKDKADWYDPLIEKDDELFKGIDRDSLM
ncbi:hypothetical protein ABW636_04715 [Aquimarina sp. 2201CG1-2-11]|uniref:hypothetical protein n=1 Tax=Aquimarina discodermiae TaxID=3231043 RepID=UPI0034623448